MDATRFDSLTRQIAERRLSRRAALSGIATLVAGLLGARASVQAGAQVSQVSCGNQACASNPGGCKSGCVCCVYANAVGQVTNSRCRPPGTCIPGAVACPPGQAPGPSGVCAAPPTTTTTTTTPRPIGDCQGTENGGACGADGAGRCDNGRCFRTEPNCEGGGCGLNFGNSPSATLPGVVFCVPFGGGVSDTACQTSADCAASGRPGDFCGGPFQGTEQTLCASGCLV